MKKYKVNVNGEEFDVAIEEIKTGDNTKLETSVEKVSENINENEQTTSKKTTATPVGKDVEGEEVAAALPGTITSVEVSEGDTVAEGDVLFIHEAMKMENEITTPVSGTVKSIIVTEGTEVDTDEVLAVIG
jgi:biotin carboxyl carrier protein